MKRIIIHVGPEKCGSTTIQKGILSAVDCPNGRLIGETLPPAVIRALNVPSPTPKAIGDMDLIISQLSRKKCDVVVLSHEMLFRTTRGLCEIANIALRYVDDIRVIGYSRRQSDFLVSAFGQWLFRDPKHLSSIRSGLENKGLDPDLFWSVERFLIQFAFGLIEQGPLLPMYRFIDWSRSVPERADLLSAIGVSVSIGHLPTQAHPFDLFSDFLTRAGLEPPKQLPKSGIKNPAFPAGLIEGIVAQIESGALDATYTQHNEFFETAAQLSSIPSPDAPLLQILKGYIDTALFDRNKTFSERTGIDPAYFAPSITVSTEELMERLRAEVAKREGPGKEIMMFSKANLAQMSQVAWKTFSAKQNPLAPAIRGLGTVRRALKRVLPG